MKHTENETCGKSKTKWLINGPDRTRNRWEVEHMKIELWKMNQVENGTDINEETHKDPMVIVSEE